MKNEKHIRFHKELKELLLKYDAEISLEENLSLVGRDCSIMVSFGFDENIYEKFGTGLTPDLDLGRHENGKL